MNEDEWLNEIVMKYSDLLFRIAIQNVSNYSDAEDVLQEVFLRCFLNEKVKRNEIEYLQAWLIKMTINLCKDVKKAAWNKKRQDQYEELSEHLAMPGKLTEDCMDAIDALKKLSCKEREIIYLDYLGYTNQEIAKLIGIKLNSVNSKKQRARGKVKDYMRWLNE